MTKNNMTFKHKDVKVLVEAAINQVTASRNGNICIEDVEKYEYGGKICYLIPVYI